jgi:hypothetical protein
LEGFKITPVFGSSGLGGQIPIPPTSTASTGMTAAMAESSVQTFLRGRIRNHRLAHLGKNLPVSIHQPGSNFRAADVHSHEPVLSQSHPFPDLKAFHV